MAYYEFAIQQMTNKSKFKRLMIAYDTIHGCVCNIHATWKMLHYVQLQLKPPPSEISKKVVSIKSMGGGVNVDITGIYQCYLH